MKIDKFLLTLAHLDMSDKELEQLQKELKVFLRSRKITHIDVHRIAQDKQ